MKTAEGGGVFSKHNLFQVGRGLGSGTRLALNLLLLLTILLLLFLLLLRGLLRTSTRDVESSPPPPSIFPSSSVRLYEKVLI
jgi:hypothetical protein